MRLKITLAYDGTPYGGWQTQPNADTIQDQLETALAAVAKSDQKIRLTGSGRTDAGVHALGQVAHFDPPPNLTMNPYNWVPALNSKLPPSIRILSAQEVPPDFHARFAATGKTYLYRLSTAPVLSPFLASRVWHLPRQLDRALLAEALALFPGTHNFQALSARRGNETESTNYHRTITHATSQDLPEGLEISITGNGFLYKMVRLMAGAALQVAQGYLPLQDLTHLLQKPLPGFSPLCAPASGLYLKSVSYPS